MGDRYQTGNVGWTDDRVELLKKMVTEGLSASQMASRLGGGLSRNAVIGKMHRLKLVVPALAKAAAPGRSRQPQYAAPVRVALTTARTGPAALPTIDEAPLEPMPKNVVPVPGHLLAADGCRWPYGDPRDSAFGFCGIPVGGRIDGKRPIYCAHHRPSAGRGPGASKPTDLNRMASRLTRHDGVVLVRAYR